MFKVLSVFCCLMSAAPVWADAQRDPTRPLDYRVSRESVSLTLNAIMEGRARQLAIVNGQSVREGETIANTGGVRLLRIEPRAVVVGQNGRQWRLNLSNEPVRRTRRAE